LVIRVGYGEWFCVGHTSHDCTHVYQAAAA
jgi:hypothetical protein